MKIQMQPIVAISHATALPRTVATLAGGIVLGFLLALVILVPLNLDAINSREAPLAVFPGEVKNLIRGGGGVGYAAVEANLSTSTAAAAAPAAGGRRSTSAADASSPPSEDCDSWLPPAQPEGPSAPPDPWHFTKAIPRPSPCRVNGIVVEELDVVNNFRRFYSLGFSNDVEDKTPLLAYMRGFQDLSLATAARRVYLDLGGNQFDTSVTWFMRNYPLDFTEIHVFEQGTIFQIPPPPSPEEESAFLFPAMDGASRWRPMHAGPAPFPGWLLKRMRLYQKFVTSVDDEKRNKIDINRFIKETLNIQPEDTLIIKMDIDQAEWDVLPGWVQDKEMVALVDELFVEVHYHNESMVAFGWTQNFFDHTLQQTIQLLTDLRRAGYVTHPWP